jgi:hypothetical protein
MKNILVYYLLIFVPFGLIIWLRNIESINSLYFFVLLFFYFLVYRTFLDGYRLYMKNIILKKDIWKMIIPGSRFQYFKELYLK